jgi:hypothetical protein
MKSNTPKAINTIGEVTSQIVDAGIKRQHFAGFADTLTDKEKPAIGQDAVLMLYEILKFSLAGHTLGATIEPCAKWPWLVADGTVVVRRAPPTDREAQVI